MSTYPIPDLLQRWARGELTAEQALGHTLQHLRDLSARVAELERQLRQPDHLPSAEPDA
jgi:hypothetical protein